jgi:2-polyprenyl-6-hydroxyphenyl methylase / 3-demethylubiquinone-9 3-methyltransferase
LGLTPVTLEARLAALREAKEENLMPAPEFDLRGMPEPAKYDRLVEMQSPDVWWTLEGPLGGLHLLNALRVPYFEKILGGHAGKRILDVGCGGGIYAESAARAGAEVVGIDPSPRSIEAARGHAKQQGLKIDYRVGTAEEFTTDKPFDAVMAVDVLEHVEDLDASLDACARALKPGGVFGFLTHNQTLEAFTFLIWKGEYELGFIPKGNHDFHKFIPPADLEARLRARSLRPAELRGLQFDLDAGRVEFAPTPAISYIGYAVRERTQT